MRVLVDTQALIWFAEGSPKMSATARQWVDDRSIGQSASAASLWEMAIKIAAGKLTLRAGPFETYIDQMIANDIAVLPVTADDAVAVTALPKVAGHKDPFDRLIAAQCRRLGLTLVSVDAAFDAYGVDRVW